MRRDARARMPVITVLIILANALAFALELTGGETFVIQWSLIPAQIVSGHHWITILTAMFLHGSWSHILGNMIFLWAFSPEIEDAMGPWAVYHFLSGWRAVPHARPGSGRPLFHNPQPGRERGDCGGDGRVSGHLSSRPDSQRFYLSFCMCGSRWIPAALLIHFLVPHPAVRGRRRGPCADRRGSVPGARWRVYLRSRHRAFARRPAPDRLAAGRGLILMDPDRANHMASRLRIIFAARLRREECWLRHLRSVIRHCRREEFPPLHPPGASGCGVIPEPSFPMKMATGPVRDASEGACLRAKSRPAGEIRGGEALARLPRRQAGRRASGTASPQKPAPPWIVRTYRPLGRQHSSRSQGFGGPDHGAEVSRVLNAGRYQHGASRVCSRASCKWNTRTLTSAATPWGVSVGTAL